MQNLGQRLNKAQTHQVKLIFVGSIEAGKSSLFKRLVDNTYDDEDSFVGVDFKMKYTQINNNPVRLCYWDTAGQQRFNSLSPKYYKDAHTILVCYDINNQEQINNLQFWVNTAEEKKEHQSQIVIVGCKKDKASNRLLKKHQEMINQKFNKYRKFSISSKTGEGVEELEEYLMSTLYLNPVTEQIQILDDTVLKTQTKLKQAPQVGLSNKNNDEDEQKKKSCCCCC